MAFLHPTLILVTLIRISRATSDTYIHLLKRENSKLVHFKLSTTFETFSLFMFILELLLLNNSLQAYINCFLVNFLKTKKNCINTGFGQE